MQNPPDRLQIDVEPNVETSKIKYINREKEKMNEYVKVAKDKTKKIINPRQYER